MNSHVINHNGQTLAVDGYLALYRLILHILKSLPWDEARYLTITSYDQEGQCGVGVAPTAYALNPHVFIHGEHDSTFSIAEFLVNIGDGSEQLGMGLFQYLTHLDHEDHAIHDTPAILLYPAGTPDNIDINTAIPLAMTNAAGVMEYVLDHNHLDEAVKICPATWTGHEWLAGPMFKEDEWLPKIGLHHSTDGCTRWFPQQTERYLAHDHPVLYYGLGQLLEHLSCHDPNTTLTIERWSPRSPMWIPERHDTLSHYVSTLGRI